MQLKFALLNRDVHQFIFVISPSEKCGGVSQYQLMFLGEQKGIFEALSITTMKTECTRNYLEYVFHKSMWDLSC